MTTKNFWLHTKLSYPWGTTSHTLYFTTAYKNTPSLVSIGPGTLLTHFTLFPELVTTSVWLKNHFITAKDTHISNILLDLCAFPRDSPTYWCHSLIYTSENSWCLHVISTQNTVILTNQGKPLYLSLYLHAWQNTKDPLIITDMSKHPCR